MPTGTNERWPWGSHERLWNLWHYEVAPVLPEDIRDELERAINDIVTAAMDPGVSWWLNRNRRY